MSKSNMDQERRQSSFLGNRSSMIYMDLKDIIREHALQFLPAKSLFRFEGVCRGWKYQIATPFFAHNQSNSFKTVSGFFSQSFSSEPSFISLDEMAYGVPDPSLKFLPEEVDIRSSSNGLLCCQGRTGDHAYYICNPVTKQYQKLPKPDNDHGTGSAVVLIFEPSVLNFLAEYKLVCAFPSELDGYEFEIYSSSEGTWRTSGEIFLGNWKIHPSTGVYADGIVYWMGKYGKILAFDLTMERSQLHYGGGTLGVMDGKLCSFTVNSAKLTVKVLSNAYANTMQMYSHVRAWTTRSINLDTSTLGGAIYDNDAVRFAHNGIVVLQAGSVLYAYNMKTQETKQLGTEYEKATRIFSYVNSLVDIS